MHKRISFEIILRFCILIKVTKFDRNLYFCLLKKNYEAYYVIYYIIFLFKDCYDKHNTKVFLQ